MKNESPSFIQPFGFSAGAVLYSWCGSVPNPTNSAVPRAYINWILFDEHFVAVSSGSGFDLVSTTSDNVKSHHSTVTVPQGGYLYVYCSNESNYDVYFDNLQVIQTRGPLLETDNYYPFGLMQSGISSKAAGKLSNKLLFNKGSELQHEELFDGSGLEWYTTQYRDLDPQLGRWNQIDPDIENGQESVSPYQSMGDDPILYNDPMGNTPGCCNVAQGIWNSTQQAADESGELAPIVETVGGWLPS